MHHENNTISLDLDFDSYNFSAEIFGKRSTDIDKENLLLDGYFLWQLASSGFPIADRMKEIDLNFGEAVCRMGAEAGLHIYGPDNFKNEVIKFTKDNLSKEQTSKYVRILGLLGAYNTTRLLKSGQDKEIEDALIDTLKRKKAHSW